MNSLKAAAIVETMVGPCQTCQRPLQRKSDIVACKNGGHQACSACTQNQGTCNNCTTLATTKFDQEYLEKLNLPQLRQVMRALGMPVKNDVFQIQPMIDAILEYKSDPTAALVKFANKTGANLSSGSAFIIKKSAPRTNIIIISEGDKRPNATTKSPTTPKSPVAKAPWSPTTNGDSTPPPLQSSRKTSVNVGNYYDRQASIKLTDDADGSASPTGSVSQLRQNFENASVNNAVNYSRSPSTTTSSPTKKQPASPSWVTEVKVESDVIDAPADQTEPEIERQPENDEDQSEPEPVSRDEHHEIEEDPLPTSYDDERAEEDTTPNEIVDTTDENNEDAADSREAEAEAEEEHEVEVEEEVVENHQSPPEDAPDYEENAADAGDELAAAEEIEQDLEKQVEDIIEDATDQVENDVPAEEE